ncbi:MAG: hypothetical protein ACJ741_09895 [Pyrinomonadaceae bacterium]
MLIAAILFCASTSPAFAQKRSQDRDKPTEFGDRREVSDELDGSNDEYFYQFYAGPGTVKITFQVEASGTNAGATLDMFDARSRPILSDVLAQGVDGGSERVVKAVKLGRRQAILVRVKGIKYGDSGGTGVYKITLDGPVFKSLEGSNAPDNNGAASFAPLSQTAGEPDGTNGRSSHTLSLAWQE